MASLRFLGAAQQVTGSCYLFETEELGRVLLDCGMHQGGDAVKRLRQESFAFEPASIDALFLSHAHLDHSGLIPLLVHGGFTGKIYCTHGSAKLLPVMLNDAAGLYERDLKFENRRRQRKGKEPLEPIYTKKDVETALGLCYPVSYGQAFPIGKAGKASLMFYDAGHILGSAITEISFNEEGRTKKLVFSGDLGKKVSVLMNEPSTVAEADVVLMEGTYGNRCHRNQQETVDQLEQVLKETWENKGVVMIPSFAVGRTQEILFHLGLLHYEGKLDPWKVYLDSPMAIAVTDIYDECLNVLDRKDAAKIKEMHKGSLKHFLPSLNYVHSPEESMALNDIPYGAIIIAGSGMCTGGRIRHHLKQRIWNEKNTLIFIGFQAGGTLGRILVDGAKNIRLFGEEVVVKSRIETLNGFSAHADQGELIQWLQAIQGKPRTMLVHGELKSLDALSMKLWQDHKLSTEVPYLGQQIYF
jgi:metallo-beta-lactamase family protein